MYLKTDQFGRSEIMDGEDDLEKLMAKSLPWHDTRSTSKRTSDYDYRLRWNALAAIYMGAKKDSKSRDAQIISALVKSAKQGNKQSLRDVEALRRIRYHTNNGKGPWNGVVTTSPEDPWESVLEDAFK